MVKKIYCDMDGVLCDFEKGVKDISDGLGPGEQNIDRMWQKVYSKKKFFENLEWMKGGKEFWHDFLVPMVNVTNVGVRENIDGENIDLGVLTGIPNGSKKQQ